MFTVWGSGRRQRRRNGWAVPRENRPEHEVLNHRELSKHLRFVHLEHPRVHLVPRLDLNETMRKLHANDEAQCVSGRSRNVDA